MMHQKFIFKQVSYIKRAANEKGRGVCHRLNAIYNTYRWMTVISLFKVYHCSLFLTTSLWSESEIGSPLNNAALKLHLFFSFHNKYSHTWREVFFSTNLWTCVSFGHGSVTSLCLRFLNIHLHVKVFCWHLGGSSSNIWHNLGCGPLLSVSMLLMVL